MRQEDILPSVATWMDPEHIMISEVTQVKRRQAYCMVSLDVESKSQTHKTKK